MNSPRIYTHMFGVFFDYKKKQTLFKNKYFDNEPWEMIESWFVFIQFRNSFFNIEDVYYDGNTAYAITILGVAFGKGYFIDSHKIQFVEA